MAALVPAIDHVQLLLRHGIVVVPLLTQVQVDVYHADFVHTMLHHTPELVQPVFRETTPMMAAAAAATKRKGTKRKAPAQEEEDDNIPANSVFVDGGFGAWGLASSFHNPIVRRLRTEMTQKTRAFFQQLATALPSKPPRLEQLLDRFSVRRAGTSTTAESWHRDQSPRRPHETADDLDIVLGGWINLDLKGGIQRFSCQPGTHNLPVGATGFAPLTAAEAALAKAHKQVFEVPPGHWIVFFQNLVHEVYPSKTSYDSMRQFFGWRFTSSTHAMFEECAQDAQVAREFKSMGGITNWRKMVFEEQSVPPIPSGQRPRMFAKMSLTFRKPKLMSWAAEELDPRIVSTMSHKKSNTIETLPPVHCPSLAAAGFPLFPAYSADEISQHTPQLLLVA
jgi:hypothetical protein